MLYMSYNQSLHTCENCTCSNANVFIQLYNYILIWYVSYCGSAMLIFNSTSTDQNVFQLYWIIEIQYGTLIDPFILSNISLI